MTLQLSHVPWAEGEIRQYRMDADHNSYFRLREELGVRASYRPDGSGGNPPRPASCRKRPHRALFARGTV